MRLWRFSYFYMVVLNFYLKVIWVFVGIILWLSMWSIGLYVGVYLSFGDFG